MTAAAWGLGYSPEPFRPRMTAAQLEALEPRSAIDWADAAPVAPTPPASGVRFFKDIEPERVDWLWPGYLPAGKLAILDGDPGLGKSTVAIDLASRISRGDSMPDGHGGGAPAVVLLSSAEDGLEDTLRPRLDAANADLSRVATLDVGDKGLVLPDDIGRIRHAITSTGARLCVLDPLMAYLNGRLKAHNDQDVRQALSPLARMADETGCAILVVRHLRKGDSSTAVYRGGGSIAIIGQARIGLAVARDPDDADKRVLTVTKSNLGAMPPSQSFRLEQWTGIMGNGSDYGANRLLWLGDSEKTADDLLTIQDGQRPSVRKTGEPNKPQRVAQAISSVMAGNPRPGADVLKEVNAIVPFEVPAEGWLVNRARELAGVGTRWARCEHGKFSEWYPLT